MAETELPLGGHCFNWTNYQRGRKMHSYEPDKDLWVKDCSHLRLAQCLNKQTEDPLEVFSKRGSPRPSGRTSTCLAHLD